ncbi:MAG: prepilin peptidase [Alphaproteobacteria bacterium]|nr:prepilin peptidase [Alphaproteobacteria bacterium]
MIFNIFFIILLTCALILSVLISIADFRRRIIPDAYLFPLMLIGLAIVGFYSYPINIQTATIGAIFGYLLSSIVGFTFDYFMRKRDSNIISPIGMGDIKLIGVGGLWLGVNGLAYALIIACVVGAIWARIQKQKYVPFAPFFLFGGILSFIGLYFLL